MKTVAALCTLAFTLAVNPSFAVPITETFSSQITASDIGALPVGSNVDITLDYDDDTITGVGLETFSLVNDLSGSLSLSIVGTSETIVFDETDDPFYPNFPGVLFSDGKLVGIDFATDEFTAFGQDLSLSTTLGGGELLDTLFLRDSSGQDVAVAENIFGSPVSVSEPPLWGLLLLGLAILGLSAKGNRAGSRWLRTA